MDNKQKGEFIRSVRDKKGYTMIELEDEQISRSTISNIENGLINVTEDKARYYCRKLGFEFDDIPRLAEEERQKKEMIAIDLMIIENKIDLVNPDEALDKLKALELNFKENPELAIKAKYLKGRYNISKRNWKLAQKCLNKVITWTNRHETLERLNLKTAAYNELSRISYFNDNMKEALEYIRLGIESYKENAEKKSLIHILKMSKIIYLNNLDRPNEALEELNQLWSEIDRIKNSEVLLNMFALKAKLLQEFKMHKEAVEVAKEGIELARGCKIPNRSCELWNALGSIYRTQGKIKEAEACYLMALTLKDQVQQLKRGFVLFPIYKELGKLYIEQQQLQKAEEILSEAIKQKENVNPLQFNGILITLGDCYSEQKQWEKAIDPYKKALKTAQEFEITKQIHDITARLCRCWENLNNQRKFYDCLIDLYKVDIDNID